MSLGRPADVELRIVHNLDFLDHSHDRRIGNALVAIPNLASDGGLRVAAVATIGEMYSFMQRGDFSDFVVRSLEER